MSDENEETAPNPAEVAREAALKVFDDLAAEEPAAEPAAASVSNAPAAEPDKQPAAALPNPAEVAIAERIAEIVRAESALVAKQQGMRAEVDAAKAELQRAREELAAMKAKLAENPMDLLREHKWELEDIVKVAATKQTPEAVRIAKLEALIAERDRKAEAERAEQAARAQVSEAEAARTRLLTSYIPEHVKVIADELPLATAWFSPEELAAEVFAEMGRQFHQTKVAPEPAEAARKVEAALRARVEKVNPPAKVTPGSTQTPKPKPTVKPSTTVTNKQTQHRTTDEEAVKPGDIAGYRKRALALADEIFG